MPTLSEADSKRVLAQAGVPVLDERVVATADEAADAADAMGFPVVAKLCGDAIAHKTERGLVRLRLGAPAGVHAAATQLLAPAPPHARELRVLAPPLRPCN